LFNAFIKKLIIL